MHPARSFPSEDHQATFQRYGGIVIGAGHNGLTVAAYLAKHGLNILVLEQAQKIGGCTETAELFPGFKFNRCSHQVLIFQHTPVPQDLELEKFGLRLIPTDPFLVAPFPNGKYLVFYQDVDKTVKEIEKFSTRDAKAYRKFTDYWMEVNKLTSATTLSPPPPMSDLLQLLKGEEAEEFLRTLLTSSGQFLDETFEADELKAAIAWIASLSGLGPREPGSALFAGWHVGLHAGGIASVQGGMGMIPAALAAAAEHHGAQIHTNSDVNKILVEDGQVRGVLLSSGERIESRLVISAVDPKQTFLRLLDSEDVEDKFRKRIERLKAEAIGMKVDCALDSLPDFVGKPPPCVSVALCPSMEYLERAHLDFQAGQPSREPVHMLGLHTLVDPSQAPEGKHTLYIWAQWTPSKPKNGGWTEIKDEYVERIIGGVAEFAPGLRKKILNYSGETPQELEKRLKLTGACIYHADMGLNQLFSFRPATGLSGYRTPIHGLYITGAGTHPGGAVSALPGYNASQTILQDLKTGTLSLNQP